GQASTATAQVTVNAGPGDAPPVAALAVSPSSGSAPLAVSANASGSTDNDQTPIASYRFDFGDGSPAVGPQAGATATHMYSTAGTYTVSVTVRDTVGQSSNATAQVTVSPTPVGTPSFETDLSDPAIPRPLPRPHAPRLRHSHHLLAAGHPPAHHRLPGEHVRLQRLRQGRARHVLLRRRRFDRPRFAAGRGTGREPELGDIA